MKHKLYKTGDTDIPEGIKDRNGEVVLDMCKVCGKAESELDQPCITVYTKEEVIQLITDYVEDSFNTQSAYNTIDQLKKKITNWMKDK